ncbi:MAG: TlpA disulfide reductase family protein [Bacteroidales bacterium]
MKVPHIATLVLLILFLYTGCREGSHGDGSTRIRGELEGSAQDKIRLSEVTPGRILARDSVYTSPEGTFEFVVDPDETTIYKLDIGGNMLACIAGKDEELYIEADYRDLRHTFDVHGNEESELLETYLRHTFENERKADSLAAVFEESKNLPGFPAIRNRIEKSYVEIYRDQQEFTRNFIRKHPSALASLIAINQVFGSSEVLDKSADFELFDMLDRGLNKKYPGNKHALKHHEIVQAMRTEQSRKNIAAQYTSPGKVIPEFSLKTPEGKRTHVRDFRGRPLILYFWASLDARSRKANHQLKEILKEYGDVQVMAVSFDQNKELWKAAMKIDSPDWTHVSDLKGMSSPVRVLLNLPEKLPFYYLVDENGVILAKGGEIADLRSQIAELNANE